MGSKTNKAKSMNVINKLSPNSQNLKPLSKPTNVKEKSSKLNLSLLKKNSNLWLFNLKEATSIAEGADRKYEEVARKLKIVEGDLERMVDKSEEFEAKVAESEAVISENNEQLKKMETFCGDNADKEDNYDNTMRNLSERLKLAETAAEFGERTVEKLESNIDVLQGTLYGEKMAFKELSLKLDKTLQDMMHLQEDC